MKPLTAILLSHLFSLLLTNSCIYAQIIYVKQDATGANNGTSWQDAYSDFETALANATDSAMIWIAAGVYHPGGSNPDTSSVFAIRNNISIYGGFSGTETNLEERDPIINITVLSGDLFEDDMTDDFDTNRTDNTRHVIYVDSLLDRVIIDGLTIKGGHTRNVGTGPTYHRNGGGIYVLSPVNIIGCRITENFGRNGGGIFLSRWASPSLVSECDFSHNKSTERAAGIYAYMNSDLHISHCSFTDNQTVRGAVYPEACNNVYVEYCLFENNISNTFGGGALFSFTNIDLRIRNCDFIRNSATFGGALVINGTQIPAGTLTNNLIENCRFNENMALNYAGAIYLNSNPDILIKKCQFIENTASRGGAAFIEQPISSVADSNSVQIDSCRFNNNKALDFGGGALFMRYTGAKIEHCQFDGNFTNGLNNGSGGHLFMNCPDNYVIMRNDTFVNGTSLGYGGGVSALGQDAQYLFDNCTFENNSANDLGGAVHHLFGSVSTYRNCSFEDNKSNADSGGALSVETDSTTISVIQSEFISNSALLHGGAIFCGRGSGQVLLNECDFMANHSTAGFGGAVYVFEGGDDDIGSLRIRNSFFRENFSNFGGGAVYAGDSDLEIISCLFYFNHCFTDGYGGALSLYASEMDTMEAKIVNTTFASNISGHADAFSQKTDSIGAVLTTSIQNCIFSNPEFTNYIVEGGTPTLLSLGGNMSDDTSLSSVLNHKKDLDQVSPLFNDPEKNDYSLTSNSPGIDGGVEEAPDFDIIGNPRVNAPDIGAFENQMPVRVKERPLQEKDVFVIYPNLISDQDATGKLINLLTGNYHIQITDMNGRIVYTDKILKEQEDLNFTLPMKNLGTGQYLVQLSNGQKTWKKNIIKIE